MKTHSSRTIMRLAELWLIVAILALNPRMTVQADTEPSTIIISRAPTNSVTKPAFTAPNHYETIYDADADDDKGHKDHSFNLNINTDDDKHGERSSLTEDLVHDLIPLTGIIATFGMPVLIVFFICYFKYRRRQENLAMAREYLNKGLPVPVELLDPSQAGADYLRSRDSASRTGSDLRRGFRLFFIGLGVTIALYIDSPHSTMWGWGLIPTVMGLGYLISGWVENRRGGSAVGESVPPPTFPGKFP
jgi:hypothetical protein